MKEEGKNGGKEREGGGKNGNLNHPVQTRRQVRFTLGWLSVKLPLCNSSGVVGLTRTYSGHQGEPFPGLLR